MPAHRYDPGVYVTNGGTAITHGKPAQSGAFVGIAIKQKAPAVDATIASQAQIAASEDYYLITKGEVTVSNTGITGVAKGDAVYIDATNALTTTATSNKFFGRVVDLPSQRGLPAAMVRIDLDYKA